MSTTIRRIQEIVGAYNDGVWGPKTAKALTAFCRKHGIPLREAPPAYPPARLLGDITLLEDVLGRVPCGTVAWGAKVRPSFRRRVQEIAYGLKVDPDHIMHCMAFETGRTFSPSVLNRAGSGAAGLIQFMPSTARLLRTTTKALIKMSAEEQLSYVYRYLWPMAPSVATLDDLYMCILWPAAVGKKDNYVLFRGPSTTYRQNAGLDKDKDRIVTKLEAAAAVRALVPEGERLRA